MKTFSRILLITVSISLGFTAQVAQAAFHLWSINEVFSNADGSVQFIELTSSVGGQQFLSGHGIVASNGGTQSRSISFNTNLPGDSANRSFLIATQKFADITGLTPDYIIPSGFIYTNGGSINFAEGASQMSYTAAQLPKNGVQSINATRVPQIATPKNFAGLTASIETHARPSINPSTLIMNTPVLNAPGIGIGNVNFSINLANLTFTVINDYYLYAPGITGGNNPVQFQNGSVLYIPAVLYGNEMFEFSIQLIADNPSLVFGNPVVHSVRPASPEELGTPPSGQDPDPGDYSSNPGSGY